MIKAIIDSMSIKSVVLNRTIIKSMSKRPITLDDVKYYDLDLYQQLKIINDNQVKGNPQLEQTRFTYKERDINNTIQEYELVPNLSLIHI